jgi:hypothetical protein
MTVTWSPALAPYMPPADLYAEDFDDAPDCLSCLYVPVGSLSLGPLGCTLDHRASGLPWLHGTVLAGRSKEWTDEMAAESLTEFGPARLLCTDCNDLPQSTRGLCASCARHELACDDIDTESEAAA